MAGGDSNRVEDVGVGGGSGGTVGSSGNGPVTVQSVPGRSASRSYVPRTTCASWHLHPSPNPLTKLSSCYLVQVCISFFFVYVVTSFVLFVVRIRPSSGDLKLLFKCVLNLC